MLTTIITSSRSSAQGEKIRDHADGRVTIAVGRRVLTGQPVARVQATACTAL